MTTGYEVKKEQGFLCVITKETITDEAVDNFFREIPKIASEYGETKILVDCRAVTKSINILKRYQYAIDFAEYFKSLKVAFVANVPLRDPKLFGEIVAVSRGANVRMCTNMAEAFFWLDLKPEHIPIS